MYWRGRWRGNDNDVRFHMLHPLQTLLLCRSGNWWLRGGHRWLRGSLLGWGGRWLRGGHRWLCGGHKRLRGSLLGWLRGGRLPPPGKINKFKHFSNLYNCFFPDKTNTHMSNIKFIRNTYSNSVFIKIF